MTEAEAKKLKKGDRVVFNPNNDPTIQDKRCGGEIVETTGRACGVMWDDGSMGIQYFNTMQAIERETKRRAA